MLVKKEVVYITAGEVLFMQIGTKENRLSNDNN